MTEATWYAPRNSMTKPRIASGPRSFMRLPVVEEPLTASGPVDIAVVGVPTDSAVSYRSGARFGPEAIRSASILLRDHNPATGVNITTDLSMVDAGDAPVVPGYHDLTLQRLQQHLEPLYRAGIVPLILGGDHSLVMAEMRALAAVHGKISVVHFDAHGDVLDDYYGVKHFHGTMFRRAVEEGVVDPARSIQLGMRGSVHPDDVDAGVALGYEVIPWPELDTLAPQEVGRRIRARVGDSPVLVSFDIDFIDPAYAPGTGTPEVGGPSTYRTVQYLRALGPLNYVGLDIVEVAPPYDHGDITSHAAAVVAFELLGQVAVSRRERRQGARPAATAAVDSVTGVSGGTLATGSPALPSVSHQNLTSMESLALVGGCNLSDGHPRMPLTETQRDIVRSLDGLFAEAAKRPFLEIETEAHSLFLRGIGQHRAPLGTGRLVSCYSSSVAMDIAARALATRTNDVALVHPTFDNIPDLLKARGLRLHPVEEQELTHGELALPDEVGAVFVTTPNNPTGWVMPADSLRRLAEMCARTGRVIALDTCFRAQDERAQYDTYQILEEAGPEWLVIEDTGKLWPMLELKAGFLAWGANTRLPLADAFSDVLLSVSPMVLLLIARLAQDANDGGYRDLRRLIADNRQLVSDAVLDGPLALTDPDARISVARLTLPENGVDAQKLYEELLSRGVHTLPCDAFHWARNDDGRRFLRVSLARSRDELAAGIRVVAEVAARQAGHR
ncbi:agmatinase/enduracididine biosynthesis enzyme MppP,TIGR04462 [Krasilnikovia cinnamomea]|uniref:Agmatinase/enduracididine biosynthesis enzyme MppP,TIGR04462 n=1 Tax=Krasilnikovia cinnamomea TaxID=349313 RepID=A0A4Q7ZMZ7_9ACTN|nr:agmatinase [Krasilnikovia cinnamomea]RZU51659.1 agmatinase/enduracididine biosynthesis enzyme MppP,TIGR04462 [Krasilnikovia cinnamomea]